MIRIRPVMFAALTVVALFNARPALAGPPLLCFPFNIGTARSLPMGTSSWQAIDPAYNVSRLVGDTVALLGPETPVLVRMETIRRATIYAASNPTIASALLTALQTRAAARTVDAPLAVFDFGYLVETYREAQFMFKAPMTALDSIDGYQLVLKAHALQRDDQMSQAAKLIQDGRPKNTR